MGLGVVISLRVEVVLPELVGYEVDALEWYVHGELSDVAPVESFWSFDSVDALGTVDAVLVRAVKDLHPLLDDWKCANERLMTFSLVIR